MTPHDTLREAAEKWTEDHRSNYCGDEPMTHDLHAAFRAGARWGIERAAEIVEGKPPVGEDTMRSACARKVRALLSEGK